jgi:formylglycine-generating enzyme required for sulfatase activity
LKVYLSSTLIDLLPERQAVRDVLGGECTVVESYIADERSVRESCEADVAGCDLYIGIFGLRYGSIEPGKQQSITQLEYRAALAHNRHTLLFVKDKNSILADFHDAVSGENPRELIESFRASVTSGAEGAPRSALFKTPEELKLHVLKALGSLRQRHGDPKPKPKPIEGRPYPGLRAFRTAEADRFFGRDDEANALLERLLVHGQRFVALIGASGSGKSSLVYAGLIPELGLQSAGALWRTVTVIPGKQIDPFLSLATALEQQFPDAGWQVSDLAQRLREHPAQIAAVAKQALGDAAPGAQLLLFVDQFEEAFASKVNADTRAAVFALLTAAVACPLCRVVISMRADFYAQWPQDEACTRLLRDGHFPVAVPGPVALAKMIEGPAKAAGLHFQPPQLVQRLLDDTGTAPGALALAEFALAKLYDLKEGDALTEAAYTQFGGVAGAIDGMAEGAVRKAEVALARTGDVLDDEAWSRLFVAIASVEDRGTDLAVVRRRAAASELPGAMLTLVQHLVNERLLVSSAGISDRPALYEVGHEAVFSHWQRFKKWFEAHADDLALRRQAERAAAEWDKAGRPDILRWGWERQKPALEALRKLAHLPVPPPDPDYADTGIAVWRMLQDQLPDTPLKQLLYPEPLALIDELGTDNTPNQRREEIGLRLNQMGDPRRCVGLDDAGLPDISWIAVPAGEVTLEIEAEPDSDVQPRRGRRRKAAPQTRFAVQAFELARYPVTWCQYNAFLKAADGYCNPAWWENRPREEAHGEPLWAFHNYPAVNVSWHDAMAYCRWLSAKRGQDIRLPNECEWQWAATADTAQEYPWPGDWNPARANSEEAGIGRTVAVGLYPLGSSPLDFVDLSGNVWVWCLNDPNHPDRMSTNSEASRVLRGGSWGNSARVLRASNRFGNPPDARYTIIGFRVCRVSPIEIPATGALPTEPVRP